MEFSPEATEPASVHIGTSGWNYDHWLGTFYPEDLKSGELFDFYQSRFGTVEVNNTFYQLPEKGTIIHWREQAPEGFLYSVKASRYITHMKKLKDPKESLSRFLERVALLENTLGPILFQLPPNWRSNPERLESFLHLLPENYRYTFELRDERWINDDITALLKAHDAAFCIYEFAGRFSPRIVTTDWVYIRLHGPGDAYQGDYSRETLREWADSIIRWRNQGKEVFCYFDNDQSGYAPKNAIELMEVLRMKDY